ncbi:hypothetical protein [Streptomyces malaysiensis]|uniref:hypothetical protein n=1 Tax=Streptomyces malaysiensis TaxID=92644 RepID=UPI0008536D9D|nr:hypothetical protein [Streptomyces sp. SPMA113]
MTETLHTAPPTPQQPTTPDRPAYDRTLSIPRLITELTAEDFWYRYARVRGDAEHFHDDYLNDRRHTALLLRAVIADLVALADPTNDQAAASAAKAANAVRSNNWQMTLPAQTAREWLREQYREWEESSAPHPPNCPGGCDGSGEVLTILTWQDDGTPLHQEPIRCNRGEPEDPHGPDCECRGTGFTYDYTNGERNLCLAYSPQPNRDDSSTTGRHPGYSDEPPF